MLHVPYRTGAEALIDFLGGTVDVIIDNVMFPHVRAGQATLLAVTSDRRFPAFPDVPTVMEAGYDVKLANFAAIFVPKATPQAIKDKLAEALSASLQTEVRIEVQAGDGGDTPARRDAADKARRQAQAEAVIREDPLVQSLLQQFSTARLVPGSIRPA